MTDLAAIVARDAAYDTMRFDIAAPVTGRMQMAHDRRALLALLRETRDALEHLALHTPFCAWTRRAKDCDCGLVEIRGRLAALDTEPVR